MMGRTGVSWGEDASDTYALPDSGKADVGKLHIQPELAAQLRMVDASGKVEVRGISLAGGR